MNMPEFRNKKLWGFPHLKYEMNLPECNTKPWKFISLSNSRFCHGAKLTSHVTAYETEISGRIGSKVLSSNITYASYLIFRMPEAVHRGLCCFYSTVSINGLFVCQRRVFLRPPLNSTETSLDKHRTKQMQKFEKNKPRIMRTYDVDVNWPKERIDGWMEVEMGEFYNENGEDREVEIMLTVCTGHIICGTVFLGIELRPIGSLK